MKHNITMHHGCYNVSYIYHCPFYRCPVAVTTNKHEWDVVAETFSCLAIFSTFWCQQTRWWVCSITNETTKYLYNNLPLVFVNCYCDLTSVKWTIVDVWDIVTPMMNYDILNLIFVYLDINSRIPRVFVCLSVISKISETEGCSVTLLAPMWTASLGKLQRLPLNNLREKAFRKFSLLTRETTPFTL